MIRCLMFSSLAFAIVATTFALVFAVGAFVPTTECPVGSTRVADECLPACAEWACAFESPTYERNYGMFLCGWWLQICAAAGALGNACFRQRWRSEKEIGTFAHMVCGTALVGLILVCLSSPMWHPKCARGPLFGDACVVDCEERCGPAPLVLKTHPIGDNFFVAGSAASTFFISAAVFSSYEDQMSQFDADAAAGNKEPLIDPETTL